MPVRPKGTVGKDVFMVIGGSWHAYCERVTAVLLAPRFVLELALLTALAVAGWRLPDARWAQVALAVALPVAAAVLWGLVVSPKARAGAPLTVRLAVEIALFASASALLWATGSEAAAITLAVAETVVLGGLLVTGNPPGPPSAGAD